MRIVAGTFRSRIIEPVPGNDTRPTADKIKESVFNRIGPYFDGGRVLDLFGGSGNIGFEALSRGMAEAVFADHSRVAVKTIEKNARTLGVQDHCKILAMDYQKALAALQGEMFDLIYLDPPYKQKQLDHILEYLCTHNMIAEHGLVVCECLPDEELKEAYASLSKRNDVLLGITRIAIYERNSL